MVSKNAHERHSLRVTIVIIVLILLVGGSASYLISKVTTNNHAKMNTYPAKVYVCFNCGTITGEVTDASESDDPLQGATVTVENITTTTDSTGSYRMRIPAGRYNVTASSSVFLYNAAAVQNITVTPGAMVSQNFSLKETLLYRKFNEKLLEFIIERPLDCIEDKDCIEGVWAFLSGLPKSIEDLVSKDLPKLIDECLRSSACRPHFK